MARGPRNPEVMAIFEERKRAYTLLLGGHDIPHRKLVLADLAAFCRKDESTFHADPRIHALLEGRREVLLRISAYLELTVEQLYDRYAKEGI